MSGSTVKVEVATVAAGTISVLSRRGDVGCRTVLFLHGIGSNSTSFMPLLSALPQRWNLLAWDAPGYGQSTPLEEPWPLAIDYAEAIERLLLTHSIDSPVDIVAHSLGCLMGAALARHFPARIGRIVLMAPALGYGVPRGGALPEGVAGRIAELERLGPDEFAARRAPRLVYAPERHGATADLVRAAMARITMPGYGQAARMLGTGDLLADVAHVRGRVLLINGRDDQVTPLAGAERLLIALKSRASANAVNTRLHVVADAGHAVSIEQPMVVARAIAEFLEAA